jgi:hypothetical protein
MINHSQLKLLGESIREVGVLILVFVPLDIWIAPSANSPEPTFPRWLDWAHFLSVDHWRILLFGLGGIMVVYYGIKIESRASASIDRQKGGD